MTFKKDRFSLLSSNARVQVPWIKVTIADKYTFGIFDNKTQLLYADDLTGQRIADVYKINTPKFIGCIKSLDIVKINGQVNQYTLLIDYPITQNDDPNFFDRIFSVAGSGRKITFTYGDAAMPTYVYKEEEAIITTVTQTFSLDGSAITYTVSAISGAALTTSASMTFPKRTAKPSAVIKELYNLNMGGIKTTFTGMNQSNWDSLIAQDDQVVDIDAKLNISTLDYISYLVSCMYSTSDQANSTKAKSIYTLTFYDDTTYDKNYTYNRIQGDSYGLDKNNNNIAVSGPYFRVSKVTKNIEHADAYEIDIGYNTSNIVTSFQIQNNQTYSLYYDYQTGLPDVHYVRHINNQGLWEDFYAPPLTSKNNNFVEKAVDKTWWTKVTQFPISATITVLGLLRPAQLLTYVRLNVIFPGGHKHNSSGLYIVTSQQDSISESGYTTTLGLTRVGGDDNELGTTANDTTVSSITNKLGQKFNADDDLAKIDPKTNKSNKRKTALNTEQDRYNQKYPYKGNSGSNTGGWDEITPIYWESKWH